ncbi:hypothetical protein LTR08_007589 [Meristemomyces frigidus]|nr:hypothetical protein LTR08_007589 [Meristemomyces frigidus]
MTPLPPPRATTGVAESDMEVVVGGALAPVHTSLPQRSQPRIGPELRLPSFEALGIAAPHPDRRGQNGAVTDTPQALVDLFPREALRSLDDLSGSGRGGGGNSGSAADCQGGKQGGGRTTLSPAHHLVATLTPPAEGGGFNWNSSAKVAPDPMDSQFTEPDISGLSINSAPADGPDASAVGDAPPRITIDGDVVDEPDAWVDGAIESLLANLHSAQPPNNPLRVLSHALPSPSVTGHIFQNVISAIHNSTPASPPVWINVFHAIPGRFNLADLPTSPPNTPGPAVGGDDYFTQKIFDSAVPISDYQEDLSSLPRSPRPIVPPSSINVSIVERYLPPTSSNEYADMFNPNGPSVLVDRLVELSPNSGTLIFIYPTKTGAQTFMRDYLGPILDPMLRSMCVVHGLSTDLSRTLGNMCAVDRLLEHDQLEHQISQLCAMLSQRSTSMQRLHGNRAHFSLVHAGKKEVPLTREVWARDWWTKQEKPRVRDAVTRYVHEAQKKCSNEHVERPVTPAELIQYLLEGVMKKGYSAGQEPEKGVEVSVFVIKRSE